MSESLATREAHSPLALATLDRAALGSNKKAGASGSREAGGLDWTRFTFCSLFISKPHVGVFPPNAWPLPEAPFLWDLGKGHFRRDLNALPFFPAGPTPYTLVSIYTCGEAGKTSRLL